MERRLILSRDPGRLARWILVAGLLFMLGASLPGHMSYDSLAQLREGRFGLRETWGPAVYAAILGFFDEIVPGTGLYVTASAALFYLSLCGLFALRPRSSWWAPPVAFLVVASPLSLIYQGVVWKDVFFANLLIVGFLGLAHAQRLWTSMPARVLILGGVLFALALATLTRQNGLIVIPFAALALTASRWKDGPWRAVAWGLGGFVAVIVLAQVLGFVSQPRAAGPDKATGTGVRIVQHYDLIGAVAHDPSLPLPVLEARAPTVAAAIRRGVAVYSPERVDFLERDPTLGPHLWQSPEGAIAAQWRDLILNHPKAYLAHRLDVFRWVFLTPRLERCLPVFVGVDGPAGLVRELKLVPGQDPADLSLSYYATYFYGTPVFSHLAYAAVALIVAGFLLWRRDGADGVVAALLLSALTFAASFLIISIACDYRYLYALDLAAMVGVLYVAIDPRSRGRIKMDAERV